MHAVAIEQIEQTAGVVFHATRKLLPGRSWNDVREGFDVKVIFDIDRKYAVRQHACIIPRRQ
jgi:hypothetical protein